MGRAAESQTICSKFIYCQFRHPLMGTDELMRKRVTPLASQLPWIWSASRPRHFLFAACRLILFFRAESCRQQFFRFQVEWEYWRDLQQAGCKQPQTIDSRQPQSRFAPLTIFPTRL